MERVEELQRSFCKNYVLWQYQKLQKTGNYPLSRKYCLGKTTLFNLSEVKVLFCLVHWWNICGLFTLQFLLEWSFTSASIWFSHLSLVLSIFNHILTSWESIFSNDTRLLTDAIVFANFELKLNHLPAFGGWSDLAGFFRRGFDEVFYAIWFCIRVMVNIE